MKTPLLLIPGLLCDEAVWSAQVQALSDVADVRVVLNGPSDSLGALADAIIAQAPPRFAVAGHSMGGRIALEVARRVPTRLTGLALLDTGYEALAPGEAGEREKQGRYALLETARRAGMREMARVWVQGMVHPARLSDHELLGVILDMFARKTPDLFAAQIQALLTRPDARSVFATVACPALVLCGREDGWAPPTRHQDMTVMLRRGSLTVIPDCGHMAPIECPEAVSKAMRQWLKQAPHS
ncbi:MAG TPA: alpha/beta hydrolase [Steroidobacteraceae bacterium]|nr:alpha/beta hydrolase [Steroidobacteraceae bacterium]